MKLNNFDELKVYVRAKSTDGNEGIGEGSFYQVVQSIEALNDKFIAILNDNGKLKALDINYFESKL